jgi:hypothetical protein
VARSEKETTENGDLLHIYYWFVAAQVSPKLIREAIFSYTVLTEFLSDDLTQSEVKLIDQLVGRARFAAPMTAAGE